MNKYLTTILLSAVMVFALTGSALAATISLSPTSINAVNGHTFSETVMLNPQGTSIYTAKVEINFPKNLLEAESFTFAGNWIPLTQSGYDAINNTNGLLIKSAGYPGGISTPVTLGTIVFRALANGNGTIFSDSNSLAYDANSNNALSGTANAYFTVSNPLPAVTPKASTPAPSASTTTPATTPEVQPAPVEQPVATTTPAQTSNPQQASLLSAFGSLISLGTNSVWIGIIVVLLLVLLIWYIIAFATRKQEKQM